MKTLKDVAAPRKVVKKVRERDVQKQSVAWMRRRGYWARKFSSPSQRSVPDYLFAIEDWRGRKLKFACEFKAPGKEPTEAQWEEIRAMQDMGWEVFYSDSFEEFAAAVLKLENAYEIDILNG